MNIADDVIGEPSKIMRVLENPGLNEFCLSIPISSFNSEHYHFCTWYRALLIFNWRSQVRFEELDLAVNVVACEPKLTPSILPKRLFQIDPAKNTALIFLLIFTLKIYFGTILETKANFVIG